MGPFIKRAVIFDNLSGLRYSGKASKWGVEFHGELAS